MHDPKVVAFEIRRPWPQVRRKTHNFNNGRRFALRHSWAKWYKPWEGWSCFWKFGAWEAYWPSFITVWHVEPDGQDSGTVCSRRSWSWHIHHWRIQFSPWQHFRRWAFTRCEWCDGKSRKSDYVNVSMQWDRDRGSWWRGERGLFHRDCSSIARAHKVCTCEDGLTDPRPGVYRCLICDKVRKWDQDGDRSPYVPANRILASIPEGQRDAAKSTAAGAMWRAYKHATAEDDPTFSPGQATP